MLENDVVFDRPIYSGSESVGCLLLSLFVWESLSPGHDSPTIIWLMRWCASVHQTGTGGTGGPHRDRGYRGTSQGPGVQGYQHNIMEPHADQQVVLFCVKQQTRQCGSHPAAVEGSTQCRINAGLTSQTLAQHRTGIGQLSQPGELPLGNHTAK